MDATKRKVNAAPLKTMGIVVCCVLVNFLGKRLAAALQLPLWLDCLGTAFAAYVLGPASGAVVGCAGNVIYSFWNANSLVYGLTSAFIGLSIGMAARRRSFETFFGATGLGVAVGAGVAVGVSPVINFKSQGTTKTQLLLSFSASLALL